MKLFSGFLLATIIISLTSVHDANCQNELQSGLLIPVYPGAKLVTDIKPDEDKICCSFRSKESFEKVISFYESALKIKALDASALAAKLPFLKQQVDMMQNQMPAGFKIRFFVLKEIEFQGQKGAEMFEISSAPDGVAFSLTQLQLTPDDQHFAAEWDNIEGAYSTGSNSGSGGTVSAGTKVLEGALPSSGPEGFVKGETETYSNPDAVSIMYSKLKKKGSGGEDGEQDKIYEIRISISDEKATLESAREMIKPGSSNEKAVKVKGKYDGREGIEKNDYGCQQSVVAFLVNNRFMVEITAAQICDISVIYKLIDKMNLDVLLK